MIKSVLIVGLGSFMGGVFRYMLSVGLSRWGKILSFPISIFMVNILGCFLIGILYGYFKNKEVDILVSTTVIEVGVNVPNATIMVIMDADRFGLSQLHQLRGRVGRGDKQSYAVLVANPKTESGKKRMKIMTETTDGFVLAEEDLKMRGSGEIFGTRQSGIPEFQVADIVEDYPILEEARKVASQIVQNKEWRRDPNWHLVALHLDKQDYLD